MRFEVRLRNETIGFTEPEGGDPPMGVAGGRFFPTPAYKSFQPYCVEHRESWRSVPELTVSLVGGRPIECVNVVILDYSCELGTEEIEVEALGIPYPLYGELFPQHVEVYRNQFKKDG